MISGQAWPWRGKPNLVDAAKPYPRILRVILYPAVWVQLYRFGRKNLHGTASSAADCATTFARKYWLDLEAPDEPTIRYS